MHNDFDNTMDHQFSLSHIFNNQQRQSLAVLLFFNSQIINVETTALCPSYGYCQSNSTTLKTKLKLFSICLHALVNSPKTSNYRIQDPKHFQIIKISLNIKYN
jgi:hypothetical protein